MIMGFGHNHFAHRGAHISKCFVYGMSAHIPLRTAHNILAGHHEYPINEYHIKTTKSNNKKAYLELIWGQSHQWLIKKHTCHIIRAHIFTFKGFFVDVDGFFSTRKTLDLRNSMHKGTITFAHGGRATS
ncbi:hypothetical protein ACJX0J_022125, partial [Zea mays]